MSFLKKLFGRKQEEKREEVIEQQAVEQELIKEEIKLEEAKLEGIEESFTEESTGSEEEEEVTFEEEVEQEWNREEEQNEVIEEIEQEERQEQNLQKEQLEEIQEAIEEVVEQAIEQVEKLETQDELEVTKEVIEEVVLDTLVEETIEEVVEEAKPKKKGLFTKLFSGLAKTRDNILGSVDEVLKNFKKIDEDLYEELEEALIMADFGVDTTLKIMDDLRKIVKERKIIDPNELKAAIQEIITNILTAHVTAPIIDESKPNVVLVIGVNGVGKTTTIGKLAHQLETEQKKVILAAADTFRAAAIEQLQIWADRAKVDLIKQQEGSDPASVVYDGIKAAKSRNADVLICDTAGRLQNKTNLMKELEKISRIIDREYPEAHKEVLIVLDATTGQNAISQVKVFKETAKVDGIILTKLDGTAKGGAIVGICQSMGVPVKYIGVGEKIEDLQVFDPQSFAKALFNAQ